VVIPTLREPRYSQSLERGLAILESFSPGHPLLGLTEIADVLGMQRSTTHRYMSTLVALGYLERGEKRKYRLGLRVTDLGMSALNATGLREKAEPCLRELRQRSSFTVSLAVLDGPHIVYVDRVRSNRRGQHPIDLGLQPGSRLPAYATAMGKLLLAYLPEDAQDRILDETTLRRRTTNTITGKRALRKALQDITEEGFAVNDRELTDDLQAIAVPVRDENREVLAALGMAAHVSWISLEDLADALMPHLVATADRISARLGYRRDDELTSSRSGVA
jgi:IclR family pca regulon transcriptional regulator